MSKQPAFVPCRIRRLPEAEAVAAASAAIKLNPANAPAVGAAGAAGVVLPPQRIALLTTKYWGSRGVHLTVGFLDNPEANLRTRILSHMNAWGHRANVKFQEARPGERAQVRISRTPGDGYWSYLGTDILRIPQDQPTMNLDSFSMQTPDREFYRVVRHETGHTLGFPHEHMRRELVKRLDPAKTIAYFQRWDGWPPEVTRAQVLTALEDYTLTFTSSADQQSIMCYQLPGEITKDRRPIVGGLDIDDRDYEFAAHIYPPRTTS